MSDKIYRVTLTISCDATVFDKTSRANAGKIDDLVEKLTADHKDGAITVSATAGEIVTVREKSTTPRAKRGSAVADELAAMKAQIAAISAGSVMEIAPALTDEERAALNPAGLTMESVVAVIDAAATGRRVKA